MNKKLLAAAVASTFAIPGVVSAGGDGVTFYGAVKPRINVQDSNLSMSDGGSRIGWKSSKDMGNGNTVSGKIELGVDASAGSINEGDTSRVTTLSFGGDWGSATLGAQWSIMSAPDWVTCVNSGSSCAGHVGYQGRVADSLVIKGPSIGPLAISFQAEADGSDLAAWAIGTGIDLGSINMQVAYRDTDDNAYTEVAASTTVAGMTLAAGFSSQDVGADGNSLFANVSGLKLQYDETDGDADLSANYDVDLGGATMRLGVVDNEGSETKVFVQWMYSL
jgi:predicted porin